MDSIPIDFIIKALQSGEYRDLSFVVGIKKLIREYEESKDDKES